MSFACSFFLRKLLKILFEFENPHWNFKHVMCTLEGDELEREIVCVGLVTLHLKRIFIPISPLLIGFFNMPKLWDDKHIELEAVANFLVYFGAYMDIHLLSK